MKFERRQSDHLGRYYTQGVVAELLAKSIDVVSPKIVIDLGAGGGSLISEAARIWCKASFFTVDVDEHATSRSLPIKYGKSFRHFVGDALDIALNRRLGLPGAGACVALCNPPYIKPEWRQHFGEIMEEVGLSHVLPKAEDVPADVLFIAQNLRLLKKGGRLGVIAPDGLVSGERFQRFRRSLVEQHSIDQVIELPRRIFRHTEARAHIVILTKGGRQSSSIPVRQLSIEGQLSEKLQLTPEQAVYRLDYGYHSKCKRRSGGRSIEVSQLVREITRGTLSSRSRKEAPYPVFHTTDFQDVAAVVPASFRLSREQISKVKGPYAQSGDVLVARVGRNLDAKICRVAGGAVAVSDCILILRPNQGDEDRLFKLLSGESGRSAISSLSHGVGARFITTSALMGLRLREERHDN